jgi:hypothetical protein
MAVKDKPLHIFRFQVEFRADSLVGTGTTIK